MTPQVTIGIPTNNPERLRYLQEALVSALAQTAPIFEILISQNAIKKGLDETLRTWCQDAAMKDPRIRYESNTRNPGLAGNWNALADSARGEFLILLGDDDRLAPTCIETLARATDPQTQVVFANHYLINSLGERWESETREWAHRYQRDRAPAGPVADPEEWAWRNAIPISSALLRTSMVRRLRFKEDLNNPEAELYLRLAKEGGRFVFVPDFIVEYRLHSLSETAFGLYAENFVTHLLNIPARPDLEPLKERFLAEQMEQGVGRCLTRGDMQQARKLVRHPYFAHGGGWRRKIQRFCCLLPGDSGCALYRLLQHLKHKTR